VTSPSCPLPRHTCFPLKGVRQVRQCGSFRAALCPATPLEGKATALKSLLMFWTYRRRYAIKGGRAGIVSAGAALGRGRDTLDAACRRSGSRRRWQNIVCDGRKSIMPHLPVSNGASPTGWREPDPRPHRGSGPAHRHHRIRMSMSRFLRIARRPATRGVLRFAAEEFLCEDRWRRLFD
jgi:hypothetical protein